MQKTKNFVSELYEKYKHLLILSYFIVYLIWFQYIEKTVTTDFHVIHTWLDDQIPFCEYFIIPYLLWFGYVAWGIAYFAFHNKSDYYRLCAFLFTGMTVFLLVSTLYPNGHYLRPHYFAHHNFYTMLCEWLYTNDTATNLFPSIHVYNSIGIHLAVMQSDEFKEHRTVRTLSFLLMVSIILATMFLKQHSVFDVTTALILAFVMYRIVYTHKWSNTFSRSSVQKNRLPQM